MPDPAEIDLDQFETFEDVEDLIGGKASPAWAIACQFPSAYDLPKEEWNAVKRATWTDEGEEWELFLNGSGLAWYPTVSPVSDELPDPCAVEVLAGAHLVKVDGEALAILHPTHVELFCDEGTTKPWETAILHALRDQLVKLGMDVPHVSELVEEVDGAAE